MSADKYRELIQKRELDIKILSLMREEAVVNYYAGRGYRIVSQSDDETRIVFGISRSQKAADVVVEVSRGYAIIAEVKGKDIASALAQLRSTYPLVQRRYPYVRCTIFCSNAVPTDADATLPGGHCGYRAVRLFHARFPGEWLLQELQEDHSSPPFVRVGGEVVHVVFGPHL